MTAAGDDLADVVRDAALVLPSAQVHKLAAAISTFDAPGPDARATVTSAVPTAVARARARRILDTWHTTPAVTGAALATALRAATDAVDQVRATQAIEVVWTGPATHEVPVRLTPEVLAEVINSAKGSLILVSFAAYKVTEVNDALAAAAGRGVDIRLVLETSEADGGSLKGPGAAAAFTDLAGMVTLYEWPAGKRPPLPGGKHGSMHAKAALADEHTALVTSGNLTAYAMAANMELGLLVRGGPVPRRLARHFRQLMVDGILTHLT